jgi:peptide/nickel transport system substrate-binding protein
MKKILFLMVIFTLLLSACGQATPSAETETAATAAITEETAATEESAATETVATETVAPEAVQEATPTSEAAPKKLTIGVGDGYPRKGWMIESDDAFALTYYGIMETLIKVDFDGQMVPSLAETWSQVDDTTWEFKLRSGVAFQNGEPFNAQAVVTALTYLLNTPTPPRGISKDTFVSIEAIDDTTVHIKTAKFDALVPNRLTAPFTGILAPQAYSTSEKIDPFGTGTGPFILKDEVPDQSLSLVKNPNYWGGAVALDEVQVLFIPDETVRAGMVQTGEIDIDPHVPIAQIPVLEADSNIGILRVNQPRTSTLYMNNSKKPLSDIKVRQAIAAAIDKTAIVDSILEGVGSPASGPFAPTEAWANADTAGVAYDVDKAKQLLTEAGYKEGELNLSLWTYSSRSDLPIIAVAIQDMLGKAGIVAEIRVADYSSMEGDVLSGNFDMFLMSRGHVLDNYDPEGFLSSDYTCKGSYNVSHFCNTDFDDLISKADATVDSTARFDLYRQAQTILDEQVVDVFINYTTQIFAYRKSVLNYQPHPLEQYLLTPTLDITK